MKGLPVFLVAALALCGPAMAQESASYKLDEHTFNAGGDPRGGVVLTSPSYKVTFDSVGDAIVASGLAATSFRADAGFVSGYAPPGEVLGLVFHDADTLVWDAEKSAGDYNLYRDLISDLAGLGYGTCQQQDIADETTTDTDAVPGGDGYFYLVTAENRLGEEGTKGSSGGAERLGSVCP